jgi:hypothetical protein
MRNNTVSLSSAGVYASAGGGASGHRSGKESQSWKGDNVKRFLVATMWGIALLLILTAGTNADPDSCQDALSQYRSAKSDISRMIIFVRRIPDVQTGRSPA